MLTASPGEKERTSWLFVGLWILSIFAVVPVARSLQGWMSGRLGGEVFGYVTLAAVVVAAIGTGRYVIRRRNAPASFLWLALVAAIFVGYTLHLWRESVEALHFIQYGMLGVLSYRALSHRVRDHSIYLLGCMIGATVGMFDELLQWVMPGRFWDKRDVWNDFLAASLAQLAIAKGLRPSIISGWPGPASIRRLCRVGLLMLGVLAATLLNTPRRIDWYTELFPSLSFLRSNESVMLEYGYRYVDPQTGPFRSRLSPEALRRTDLERGAEAAAIVDRFRERATYRDFLKRYTPVSDPFVHEARVHLFRRNRHLEWARDPKRSPHQHRVHYTVALRENRIMEGYFPVLFKHSSYVLTSEQIEHLESQQLPEDELPAREVESTVSRALVTVIGERQIIGCLGVAMVALALIGRRYRRRPRAGTDAMADRAAPPSLDAAALTRRVSARSPASPTPEVRGRGRGE